MSTRRKILIALGACALAVPFPALAQQQPRPRRIGYISGSGAETNPDWLAAFRSGMADLNWVEGRDYVIDARFDNVAANPYERVAAELVAGQPDLLLATGNESVRVLAQITRTIPIVFSTASDPVGLGFAKSLRRPGGNITGLTSLGAELGSKRLEWLKEPFARVSHIAVLADPRSPQVKNIQDAAARLKIRVTAIALRQPADIEPGFKRAAALGINAFIVPSGPLINVNRRAIVEGIAHARVPAMFAQTELADAGGLMSYSPSLRDDFRRGAAYVDILLRADRVIE